MWVGNPIQKASIFTEHLCKTFKEYAQTSDDKNITLIVKVDEEENSPGKLR